MSKPLNAAALKRNLNRLLDFLNSSPELNSSLILEGEALSEEFNTSIGYLAKVAEWQALLDEPPTDFDRAARGLFKEGKDLRGEVGHMLSHLDSIHRKYPHHPKLKMLFERFQKNAKSVVLILAEQDEWDLPSFEGKDAVVIQSLPCRDLVDFSVFNPDFSGLKMCPDEFYSDNHIPNADIFGSGCFVSSNRVATAAHVLEAAEEMEINPKKLLFIRGHYDYGINDRVKVKTNQIYRLSRNQKKILEDSRAVYGQKGDSAWVEVEPYFKNTPEPYPNTYSDLSKTALEKGQRLYALGHGLAVPMKLSFDVEVGEIIGPYWLHSDMHVFPGNSGSPIFDANTQELVGIVNGIHALNVKRTEASCITLDLDLEEKLSVLSSQITPLSETF
jgi:S1-C subfamily serine protease